MKKENLSQKVFEKIKENKIQPKSKWMFSLKNYFIWLTGLFFIFIGALSFSVIIYMINNNGWEEYKYINDNFLSFVFLSLPYFWIILLFVFVLIADFYLKNTKKGYRYKLPVIVSLTVLVSFLFGLLFYQAGIGQTIDDALAKNAPLYEEIINPRMKMWQNPEKGLISGVVISNIFDKDFEFRDIDNKNWVILIDDVDNYFLSRAKKGDYIRIVGNQISENVFKAQRIMPMGPGRAYMMKGPIHNGEQKKLNMRGAVDE